MAILIALVVFLCVKNTFAEEPAASSPDSATSETNRDGYTALTTSGTMRLVQTTFATDANLTYRCIKSRVTYCNNRKHELTLTMEYKDYGLSQWNEFSQDYEFSSASDGSGEMRTTGITGGPRGLYRFLSTNSSCIVIEARAFHPSGSALAHPQEESTPSEGTGNEQKNCMLWVGDDPDAPNKDCLDHFTKLCKNKVVRQQFTDTECVRYFAENERHLENLICEN
uniref:Putative lipocalin-6 1 n=1 Tax=Amblyomma parvum TaxID=251391 RepID=A0A023FZB6_AMBPA